MRRATCLLTAAAVLLLAPAADAMIQLDRGIAGARLGNSKAEVRAALGKPSSVVKHNGEFGRTTTYRYRGGVRVIFLEGRVTLAGTTGRGDRTKRGVGVGSTERAVRRRVRGVLCETIAGTRSCHTGRFTAGEIVTDFLLHGGTVRRVSIGRVFD